jgi:hypothetical protein
MKRAQALTALLSFSVVACISHADEKEFDGSESTSFGDPLNWTPQGVPTAHTRITIPEDKTCTVDDDDYTVDSVVIEKHPTNPLVFGVLVIKSGYTLSLENDEDTCGSCVEQDIDHIVDGDVRIESEATLYFLDEEHVITGAGAITGFAEDSTFRVASGAQVTRQLATDQKGIRGTLKILGGPTGQAARLFVNEGLVYSAGGHITLGPTVDLQDIEGARWMLECGDPDGDNEPQPGVMTFQRQELGLLGDFREVRGSPGIFEFEQSIKTCGTYYKWGCGTVVLSTDKTFAYAFFDGGLNTCPDDSDTGTGGCNDPLTITDVDYPDPDDCPGVPE